MKQLARNMTEKKPAKPKPKLKPSLTQKERFIEYARSNEVDESGETFNIAINNLLSPKKN